MSILERLTTVQTGTALLAGEVDRLHDDDFAGETLLPDWTRRHLLAHVAYNAAALGRLLTWARTGVETPMYSSADHRQQEIAEGALFESSKLRNMFIQSARQLDESWRFMPSSAWTATVRTAQGRLVPASETLWMRAREVWVHAVDLGAGASFKDIPETVLRPLLSDIVGFWRRNNCGRGISLEADSESIPIDADSPTTTTVTGSLPAVVCWVAGRGAEGVVLTGEPSSPPRWL